MKYALTLLLSLLISALMSSFEMVYVRKAPFFNAGRLDDLLHDRTGVLATVLFWNTVALVFGSISLYGLLSGYPGAIVWAGVLAAVLFAVVGDFLPKLAAILYLEKVFRIDLYPFVLFYYLSQALLITALARRILQSRYTREEVVDMIMAYLRGKVSEEDLRFASRTIGSIYEPASKYAVKGDGGCRYVEGEPTVLDVLRMMREGKCTRVRLKEGVFDLHGYLKVLVRESLAEVE